MQLLLLSLDDYHRHRVNPRLLEEIIVACVLLTARMHREVVGRLINLTTRSKLPTEAM